MSEVNRALLSLVCYDELAEFHPVNYRYTQTSCILRKAVYVLTAFVIRILLSYRLWNCKGLVAKNELIHIIHINVTEKMRPSQVDR